MNEDNVLKLLSRTMENTLNIFQIIYTILLCINFQTQSTLCIIAQTLFAILQDKMVTHKVCGKYYVHLSENLVEFL